MQSGLKSPSRSATALSLSKPRCARGSTKLANDARVICPVDSVPPPGAAEFALFAALHDIIQAANPTFDAPLRRRAAVHILKMAAATIECVGRPTNLADALFRHTWFARLLEVRRTDTDVSWWLGSRSFLGIEPPSRFRAWPGVRRVRVDRSERHLLDVAPLAVDRADLVNAVRRLLERTPLTDVATCTRNEPAFAWCPSTLGLAERPRGRTLVLRLLSRLPGPDVDAALGRATRELLTSSLSALAAPAMHVLADRALADAIAFDAPGPPRGSISADASLARALGAIAAGRAVASGDCLLPPEALTRMGVLSTRASETPEAERLLSDQKGVVVSWR